MIRCRGERDQLLVNINIDNSSLFISVDEEINIHISTCDRILELLQELDMNFFNEDKTSVHDLEETYVVDDLDQLQDLRWKLQTRTKTDENINFIETETEAVHTSTDPVQTGLVGSSAQKTKKVTP